jgi:hypothetical protein
MEMICDITDCSVTTKPTGDLPYMFVIASRDGIRYEFQAESEDDMVLWISAIRRCSVTAPGRHTTALSRKQSDLSGDVGSIQIEDEDVILVPPETPQDGPGRKLLRQFIQANNRCAECGSGPIRSPQLPFSFPLPLLMLGHTDGSPPALA